MNVLTSLQVQLARMLALDLMTKHGLHDWQFGLNRARRRAGVCKYPLELGLVSLPGRIELSIHHVAMNSLEVVGETVLHEIAHALAFVESGHRGHGRPWRLVCERIGARPVRCFSDTFSMPIGPWRAQCSGCDKQYHRHRRPKSLNGYWCRACGPLRGQLTWSHTAHAPASFFTS